MKLLVVLVTPLLLIGLPVLSVIYNVKVHKLLKYVDKTYPQRLSELGNINSLFKASPHSSIQIVKWILNSQRYDETDLNLKKMALTLKVQLITGFILFCLLLVIMFGIAIYKY